jgi:ketosteroid isomerase-like protein
MVSRLEEMKMSYDEGFQSAVEQVGRAVNDFVGGDATAFKACWLQQAQVSIFGGRGAYEQGWDQVGPRLDWAASGFSSGHTGQEVLSMSCSGDVGYTVCLERGEVTVTGQETAAPLLLRVTHIYERDNGRWGIVHRHADPVTEKTAATALLESTPPG